MVHRVGRRTRSGGHGFKCQYGCIIIIIIIIIIHAFLCRYVVVTSEAVTTLGSCDPVNKQYNLVLQVNE